MQKGRRRASLIANFVVIIGSCLTLVQNVYIIAAGRFLTGFSAGILTMCMSKSLYETVP